MRRRSRCSTAATPRCAGVTAAERPSSSSAVRKAHRLEPPSTTSSRSNRTDKIFTVLAEFGDRGPASQPDRSQPDRDRLDNSTTGSADFNKAYYDDLFNGLERVDDGLTTRPSSGGRYNVTSDRRGLGAGVPGDAATYGANDVEDIGGSWAVHRRRRRRLVRRAARGRQEHGQRSTPTSRTFDMWDRYDCGHRRQLQRGRTATSTTSRPCTPVRARRWRRRPGRGRHLVAPLVRQRRPATARPAHRSTASRTSSAAAQIGDSGLLDRRLHRRAGERRPRRVRPRVRPRPRPARTTTTPPAARTAPPSGR